MRLDQYISQMAGSRTRAQDLIQAGMVRVNGKTITKASFSVDEEKDRIECLKPDHDYVSRAGNKLLAAIEEWKIPLEDQVVLDIGASTGGFTQCALEHGARKVYALDVGHLQLSNQLKQDERVIEMEGVNAREISKDWFDETIDFICMDVSFISVHSILEPLFAQMVPDHMVVLVKPQFEAGSKALNKSGVVRKEKDRQTALDGVKERLKKQYSFVRSIPSPVLGRKGNQEYLVYAAKRKEERHD